MLGCVLCGSALAPLFRTRDYRREKDLNVYSVASCSRGDYGRVYRDFDAAAVARLYDVPATRISGNLRRQHTAAGGKTHSDVLRGEWMPELTWARRRQLERLCWASGVARVATCPGSLLTGLR